MSTETHMTGLLSCSLGDLPGLLRSELDGRAGMLAMLELVQHRKASHPDTYRFEAILFHLVQQKRIEKSLGYDILDVVDRRPEWLYGGVLLSLHMQEEAADNWLLLRHPGMEKSLRDITIELALRMRPLLAKRLVVE